FTGAGISTESGIPDYRGPGGVWERNAPPTLGDFLDNPETQRAYWERRRTTYPGLLAAEPNAGHRALAALERAGRLLGVITQNIDGLHQRAGNDPARVVELHGTAHQVRCLDCGARGPGAEIQARQAAGETFPHCPACGGALRTATILFGEALPAAAWREAVLLTQLCDAMLVVGSSLVVQPAAHLPVLAHDRGAKLAIVNRMATPLDAVADVRVAADAGPTLAALAAALGAA
ncbi:MAG TPA: Sir2 family NAD-dependent protein deacetylase, partial [Thermomicrobiales bacterium]|nr:Sir2 family NAD-dependent protein deacetylase [Thermomicrobiales bacterium]